MSYGGDVADSYRKLGHYAGGILKGESAAERPIEITSERWYSDELEAVVLSRTSDPRFGETSYRLVNVARGEPSADLFAVPQGYELQSEPHYEQCLAVARASGRRRRSAGPSLRCHRRR